MKTPIDLLRDKYFTTGMLYESDFTKADFQLEQLFEQYYNKTYGNKDE